MITLRNTAGAFLINGDDILMMKRSEARRLNPGTWGNIGGHLEPEEMNDPWKACLREIYEETGIRKSEIEDLTLKYLLLRREKDKIGVQYVYFGNTITRRLAETDEGELHWIGIDELSGLPSASIDLSILRHYFDVGKASNCVYLGIFHKHVNGTRIKWSPLEDLEKVGEAMPDDR